MVIQIYGYSVITQNTVTFDKTGPTVTFGTNGSTIFRKTQNTMVTVTDDMDADVTTYKYLWKQGNVPPAKTDFKQTFPSGSMLSQKTGTGTDWYLWIYAKDTLGNETMTKTNPFYLIECTKWRQDKRTSSYQD